MDFKEIEQVIGQHLSGMAGVPDIAWPNKDYDGAVPYIEFRHVPVERVDPVISGGFAYMSGIVLLTVVVARDGFTSAAWDIVQDISDRFPKALRLAGSTGTVVINRPAVPGTGFVDGTYWRQPISVSYITEP